MKRKSILHSFFGPALLVTTGVLSFIPSAVAQQPLQTLQNHVPQAVSNGQAAFVAPLPATQRLYLSIVLPMRNQAQLQDLLNELYDPSSPRYHQFLTVAQFADMFGPTNDDYQAVVNWAQNNGFTVTGTPADHMSVPVLGTVAQIERAFNVTMKVYQHPTENRRFFSPDREPSLNLSVPVAYLSGLSNFSVPRPMVSRSDNPTNVSGSGPGGTSYLPSDMRAAYYTTAAGATGLTGSGQCVSLVEFDGYSINDVVSTFYNSADSAVQNGNNYILTYHDPTGSGTHSVPINNVLVNGGSVTPDPNAPSPNYEGEVVLDIAQVVGMAPGVSQVRMYLAPDQWTSASPNYMFPSSSDDYAILEQMITDFGNGVGCRQASMSWNWGPENPLSDPDNGEFDEMKSIGVSFFNASGDSGSWITNRTCSYGGCWVYPEEYPNLTAVGGTVLATSGPGGSWVSESGWSDGGGGISPDQFPIPSYQSGLNGINQTSTVYRNAPDVAMEASNDNYVCDEFYNPACLTGWAGTSFAAPRWAGFLALANQQAAANGKSPIGFINPTIYPIGEGSSYLTDFNEIAGGSNGQYSVITGKYNMVTGWGSPKGQNLINTLTSSSPPPPTCSATPQCSGSGSFAVATISLSCTEATQISTSATLCGLVKDDGGCGTNYGPSGDLTSSSAGIQGEGYPISYCQLNWCWGGNCYQQRLTP